MIKTILIVDDAPGMHLMIRHYLGSDYDILRATDGETALQLIKSHRLDLVILDLKLPGSIMGTDILHALRKKRATADIPIITMSGLPAYADGLQSIDENIVFLSKPFTKEQLLEHVDAVMGMKPVEA